MISVIIPYYNPDSSLETEKLLARAVKSARDNLDGFREYEILVINDGSPDDPDTDVFTDMPVRYLRRAHGMLGAARNTGIENAKGDMITFLDADDFYYPDTLAPCIRHMEKTGADLLEFGFRNTRCNDGIEKAPKSVPVFMEPMPGNEYMKRHTLFSCVWRYLISTRLINDNNLRFIENAYIEDEEFTPRMVFLSRMYVHTDYPVYAYYRHSGTIITTNSSEKTDQKARNTITALEHLISFRDEHTDKPHQGLERKINYLALDHIRRTLRRKDWRTAVREQTDILTSMGLFPLRCKHSSPAFRLYSLLSRCRAGLMLLHLAEKFYE